MRKAKADLGRLNRQNTQLTNEVQGEQVERSDLKAEVAELNQTLSGDRAEVAKANSDREKAMQQSSAATTSAEQLRHVHDAFHNLSAPDEKRKLDQAIRAVREALAADEAALEREDSSENLLQRTIGSTRDLFFSSLLKERLCIGGYFQSFTPRRNGKGALAVDQKGYFYEDSITSDCAASPPVQAPRVVDPNASAVADGSGQRSSVRALGTRNGHIMIFRETDSPPPSGAVGDGQVKESSKSIDLREPIVTVALSGKGEYLAASSALWSVSVWRLTDDGVERVLRWPGSMLNPASWMRWLKIVHSRTVLLTNSLAIHLEGEPAGKGRVGMMAAGQDDGKVKIVPVNAAPYERTKALAILDAGDGISIAAVRFSPDGQLLATGNREGTVRLWDLGKNSRAWKDGSSGEAQLVVANSETGKEQGQSRRELEWHYWCNGRITSLEFLEPDNESRMLAVGCQNATTHIYDIGKVRFGSGGTEEFEQLEMFQGPPNGASILLFDPSAKLLYATGPSPYVNVWRILSADEFRQRNVLLDQLKHRFDEAGKATVKDLKDLDARITADIDGLCGLLPNRPVACSQK